MPKEYDCLICGRPFTDPHLKTTRKTCSRKCQQEYFKGRHFSKNTEFKRGHWAYNYVGNRSLCSGYKITTYRGGTKNIPLYEYTHRKIIKEWIMSGKRFYTHHIDGDKTNNDVNNLALVLTQKAHFALHKQRGAPFGRKKK